MITFAEMMCLSMKHYFNTLLILLLFGANIAKGQTLVWSNLGSPKMDLTIDEYESDHIYFFHALFSKIPNSTDVADDSIYSFTELAQPLDIHAYWDKRLEESYDVLFTKTAYVLEQPASFFNAARLADPNYLHKTMPFATLTQTDSTYHLSMGFGSPDIDYKLDFFSANEFLALYPHLGDYFSHYNGFEVEPELIVVQHNYNYSRVMLQKTTKMSLSISKYIATQNDQTLIVNYTINYIHNLPPNFMGGSDFLLKKIKEGIEALVVESKNICKQVK